MLKDHALIKQQSRLFKFQRFALCDEPAPVSEEIAVRAEYGFEVFGILVFDEAVDGGYPVEREAERHLPEQFWQGKIFIEHHHVISKIEEGLGWIALW